LPILILIMGTSVLRELELFFYCWRNLTSEHESRYQGKHVPTVAVADGKATVSVPHGMADDHWIEYVWAKNQDGVVIAVVKLTPTDSPSLTFDVPEGTTAITGLESCNLHGSWSSEPTSL